MSCGSSPAAEKGGTGMDNGRNLDISGLDELLLGALTDGLELHEILESL